MNQDSKNPQKTFILLAFILALGIFLRLLNLGDKPYHHDEAIFGMYGYYQFKDDLVAYYRYIPMLNGPVLFYFLQGLFNLFGTADWVGRLPSAILGSLICFVPLITSRIFPKKISEYSIVLATFLIALSPIMIYFSRFLRHEYLIFWIYVLFLWGYFGTKGFTKIFILTLLLWLHWCVKENFYVFFAIILGFLIYEFILESIQKKSLSGIKIFFQLKNITPIIQGISLGSIVGLAFFYNLYSAFGKYKDGFYDGLYRQSFFYWFNQHSIERIKGPFSFHLFMLTWYELITLLLFVSMLVFQIYRYYNKNQKIFLVIFIFSLHLISSMFDGMILDLSIYRDFFKLKIPIDIFVFHFLLFISLIHTTIIWLKDKKVNAFFFYLFIAHFFTYSYLGEKVPWLAMYPLFFGLIWLIACVEEENLWKLIPKKNILVIPIIVIALFIYNTTIAIKTSFFRSSNIEEFIIQVHPVEEYKKTLIDIMRAVEKYKNQKPNPVKALLLDDPTWITTWYLKDTGIICVFDPKAQPITNYDIVISIKQQPELNLTHSQEWVPYSGWWVPDYNKLSWTNMFAYSLSHLAWNESGLMRVYVYTKKGFYGPL